MNRIEEELKEDISVKILNGFLLSESTLKRIISYEFFFEKEEIYSLAESIQAKCNWYKCFAILKIKEKYFKIHYLKQIIDKNMRAYIFEAQVAEPVKESKISGEYVKI